MATILSPRAGRVTASSVAEMKSFAVAPASFVGDDAFDIDLEDVSKTRARGAGSSGVYAASVLAPLKIVASVAAGVVVVALVLDPPFVLYFVALAATTVTFTARARVKAVRITGIMPHALHPWVLAGCSILIGGCLLQFLQQFEIEHIAVDFDLPVLAPDTARPSVTFFRMYNPDLVYSDNIEAIHSHINNGTVKTQRLVIDPSVDVWASDVLRYEFLRRAWQSTAGSSSYRILCIAESDVVYDEQYISSQLLPDAWSRDDAPREPLELAHVQHFWGHRVFEPFNIALLCTSSRASPRTQRWAQLASFLHRKRYRRLLPLDLLYALVPNRFVLYWDAHHGCTEYDPRCRYVHFTQPKVSAISDAVRRIELEQQGRS